MIFEYQFEVLRPITQLDNIRNGLLLIALLLMLLSGAVAFVEVVGWKVGWFRRDWLNVIGVSLGAVNLATFWMFAA